MVALQWWCCVVVQTVKLMDSIQTGCLQFPVSLSQIPKFERHNNLTINVYGFDNKEKQLHPLYVSQVDVELFDYVPTHHINLLFLSEDNKQHYCLIKNLDKLLHSQTKGKYRKHSVDDA